MRTPYDVQYHLWENADGIEVWDNPYKFTELNRRPDHWASLILRLIFMWLHEDEEPPPVLYEIDWRN